MKEQSDSKKLIPIYLQKIFLEKTDKTHFIRMPEILAELEKKGVTADRRTIYTNISLLEAVDFHIEGVQEKGNYKYHLPERTFDSNELKILIDSVAASKFLTEKKSRELIKKLKTLGSTFDNESFNRRVLLDKRVKSMNDRIFKNLDSIYAAISTNSQITFQYMRWNTQRKLDILRSGKEFAASPYAVSMNDDNYYLIAYDTRTKGLKHYRIDKMQSIKLTYEAREGKEHFETFDMVEYSKKAFGMFAGKEETISIEAPNHLAGVFIERFGDSVRIRPSLERKDFFVARITVYTSIQFYGWLLGLGKDVKILSPDSVREEYIKYLSEAISVNSPQIP
ncbi:MAG: WYL domain-containing protein [Lachnospiraceae bacterium]|nr:WYL domain-containing protein [Lachnospiraceae bacterium]